MDNEKINSCESPVLMMTSQTLSAANSAFESGNMEEALRLYDELLRVDPEDVEAIHGKALASFQSGQYQQALDCIKKAVELAPENTLFRRNSGLISLKLGQYEQAIKVFEPLCADGGEPDDLFNLANACKGIGGHARALDLYQRVIDLNPLHEKAWINLGNLHQTEGKHDEAVECYSRALSINPDSVDAQYNLAISKQSIGQPEDALGLYLNILQKEPLNADALISVGILLARQHNEFEKGIGFVQKGIEAAPNYYRGYYELAQFFREQDDLNGAIEFYQYAIQRDPEYIPSYHQLGELLMQAGRYDEALSVYRALVKITPDDAAAFNNLGAVCVKKGFYVEAVERFQRAVELEPENREYNICLALVLADLHRFDDALPILSRLNSKSPGDVEVIRHMANTLRQQGDLQEAISVLQGGLSENIESSELCNELGRVYLDAGDPGEAKKNFEKALDFDDKNASAIYNLVLSEKREELDSALAERAKSLLDYEGLDDRGRSFLGFALAKLYDDAGCYNDAFHYLKAANDIQNKTSRYDPEVFSQYCDRLRSFFDEDFFRKYSLTPSESELPVFILGSPRSGTSLAEQILSSHSRIEGRGELTYIRNIGENMQRMLKTEVQYPECVNLLQQSHIDQYIKEYLDILNPGETALRVTDKLPTNVFHLGLIAMLFPKARIIHCMRNPMDIMLSIYFQFFGKMEYAYKLENIAHFLQEYQKMIWHWKKVLSLNIIDIKYEDVVTDIEVKAREMIDFVGLEWEPGCLDFYKTRRSVKTASNWQVRQPIYKGSVERWRNYEKFLGEYEDLVCSGLS